MEFRQRQAEDRARANLAIALAASAVGAPASHVAGDTRATKVAFARQVAMYLSHVAFGMSLGRVAAAFGRDRSTVGHACRLMEERRDEPRFDRWIEALEASAAGAPVST